MTRRAELSIAPRDAQIPQQVLVQACTEPSRSVALHILILLADLHLVNQVHRLHQQARLVDLALRPAHILPKRRLILSETRQLREDDRLKMLEHLLRFHLLPDAPTHLFLDPRLVRRPLAFCLPFRRVLAVIEPLQEQQIRNPLDRIERVGESPRPELIPEGIYLCAEFRVGEHEVIVA